MTYDELKRKFRIVPTSLLDLPRDLSTSSKPEGDCQDYAKTAKKVLGLKWYQAMMIRCWSKPGLPRHAVLWVFGRGFIDSTNREFRKTPLPCIPAWPVGTPAIIIAIMLLASPLRAETGHSLVPSRMSLDGPTDRCFAEVVIVNRVGIYHRDETLETDHGAVVVNYTTVGGHNEVDADQVDVMALPDGVVADPMHIDLPDGDTGRICLMEWIGG